MIQVQVHYVYMSYMYQSIIWFRYNMDPQCLYGSQTSYCNLNCLYLQKKKISILLFKTGRVVEFCGAYKTQISSGSNHIQKSSENIRITQWLGLSFSPNCLGFRVFSPTCVCGCSSPLHVLDFASAPAPPKKSAMDAASCLIQGMQVTCIYAFLSNCRQYPIYMVFLFLDSKFFFFYWIESMKPLSCLVGQWAL